jgi:cell cycle arrest protein BUB2
MSSSPLKETVQAGLAPPNTQLQDPPSPRSHRALRRLQSSITLGQSNSQTSLISQQHRAVQQTNSPSSTNPAHNRGRSNSDATNMNPPNLGSAGRRPIPAKRSIAADALSLDRLIREGPPDGDITGGLEATRLKILDQGIKSDSDGMVCYQRRELHALSNQLIVSIADIRLADSP